MKARGGPEGWLTAVEALMRSALKAATKRAMKEYPGQARGQWVRQHPAQLVLLVSNIFWCKQVAHKQHSPALLLHCFLSLCLDTLLLCSYIELFPVFAGVPGDMCIAMSAHCQ